MQHDMKGSTRMAVGRTITSAARAAPPSAQSWFDGGERVGYDPLAKRILDAESSSPLQVFVRHEGDPATPVTFMAGFPDGSYGWSHVLPYLPGGQAMAKLFVEYVGQGDSDKPKGYRYGTKERADLIEAHWAHRGVTETSLVSFDYSSLVVMELLARRLERKAKGQPVGPLIKRIVISNGGLFTDGHSHPWFSTPLLHTPLGPITTFFAQRSRYVFAQMTTTFWSKSFHVTSAEIDQLFDVIVRRNGAAFVANAAGFVAEHKAMGDRWDFGRLYRAFRADTPILVIGSAEDPYEPRQIVLARQRLDTLGLWSRVLPGGHLTTSEHPDQLGALIGDFLGGIIR